MAGSTRHSRISSREELLRCLAERESLAGVVFRGVDLRDAPDVEGRDLNGAVFLGCTFRDREQEHRLVERGAAIFPALGGLPYEPYRRGLYSVEELLEGLDAGGYVGTRDFRIYTWFDRARRRPAGVGLRESLAQRLHDHAIDEALGAFLRESSGAGVVGVMGGHGMSRTDPSYAKVVRLCRGLARAGRCVISGGGPGVMEAANLGAWLARHDDPGVVDRALALLAPAPRFDGGELEGTSAYLAAIERYFACGRRVLAELGGPGTPPANLAMPTWFYGHEPTNLFATHVAKYFSNSLREDGLLAIATGGVVYAPGSAGTLQEVFQDLAQNHYASHGSRSPMVFLGRRHWGEAFTLLQSFARDKGRDRGYQDLLALVDEPEEALEFLARTPQRLVPAARPLWELVPPPA